MYFQIILGILYASLVEWVVHKYILHGLGKKKGSFWSFHWSRHHRDSRKYNMYDSSYLLNRFTESRYREVVGIIGLSLLHLPVITLYPFFVVTTWLYSTAYLYIHRKVHVDTAWGKKWIPWHADHHLGKDQDKNWGVVLPIWDWIFKTRKKG